MKAKVIKERPNDFSEYATLPGAIDIEDATTVSRWIRDSLTERIQSFYVPCHVTTLEHNEPLALEKGYEVFALPIDDKTFPNSVEAFFKMI